MYILDWSFIGLLSAAILFLIFCILYIFLYTFTAKKRKVLKAKKRPKNKMKRKKLLQAQRVLDKKGKRQLTATTLFFLFFVLSAGGAVFTRYYQMMNLSKEDSKLLVTSYYLLDESEKQLNGIKNGASPEKVVANIQEITSQMASIGTRLPSPRLSSEGQSLLKRHYILLQELGINLHSQTAETLKNPSVLESYEQDIQKANTSQKKVFKHFKVNESALKQKK